MYRLTFICMAVCLAGSPIAARAEGAGCRDFKGRLHPEGTRVDQSVVTGITTMTVVPVWVVCRGGAWIDASTGKTVSAKR